jgi:ribonuclease E
VTTRPEANEDRSKRRGRGSDAGARSARDGRGPTDGRRDIGAAAEVQAPATLPVPEIAATAPATAPATEGGGSGEERRGRRRRRRGRGGDRGDRATGAAPAGAPVNEDIEAAEVETDHTPSFDAAVERVEARAETAPKIPAAQRASTGEAAPAIPREPPAPRQIEHIEAAPMPVAELLPIVESSGMTLAQTDPQKLAAAQARAAEMQPPPPRMGRERPVLPAIEETPLQQVETRGQP